MASELGGTGLHDALLILGAAGVVIPAFARLKVSPVIGFIIVGAAIGPFGLGSLVGRHPLLEPLTITNVGRIEPFAEFGILLLLFAIGLELSLRRLWAMKNTLFGLGALQMGLTSAIAFGGLTLAGAPLGSAVVLGLALAMSSTALVMPIVSTSSAVGRAALAILLFQDLSLVPILFFLDAKGSTGELLTVAAGGLAAVTLLLVIGRWLLPHLFAQAARTKSPELFLATSLLVVMLASLITGAVGLGATMGALIAGLLIAETDYQGEVEVITAPLRGLALGIFLITIGMRLDLGAMVEQWPELLAATVLLLLAKSVIIFGLLRWRGDRRSVGIQAGFLMASPSELTLIVLAAALMAGLITTEQASFWTLVTAIGLTLTPALAFAGRRLSRRIDPEALSTTAGEAATASTLIFGFGRIGRLVADMMDAHDRPYLGVDGDVDTVAAAREAGYRVIFGDVSRGDTVGRFHCGNAAAVVLTMDDPVLTKRLTRVIRASCPELTIVARARDNAHAAQLYKAGATDAVPETMEGSLQMSEAVLVDIGVAMGPVIASIHEKRAELRAQIREEGALEHEPELGRRRLRDRLSGR